MCALGKCMFLQKKAFFSAFCSGGLRIMNGSLFLDDFYWGKLFTYSRSVLAYSRASLLTVPSGAQNTHNPTVSKKALIVSKKLQAFNCK